MEDKALNKETHTEERIKNIEYYFAKIMEALGLDLTSPNLMETPERVAYMYVKEVFKGLYEENKPEIKIFPNDAEYRGMVLHKNINVYSFCEHHFLPFVGYAHIAYFPNDYVIGLSKLNRIVEYYSRRPQLQERLTQQIAEEVKESLQTEDVAVWVEAEHFCVKIRGIQHHNSRTVTSYFGGKFKDKQIQDEFMKKIKNV